MKNFETLTLSIESDRYRLGVTSFLQIEFLKNFNGKNLYSRVLVLESRSNIDEMTNFSISHLTKQEKNPPVCCYVDSNTVTIITENILLVIRQDNERSQETSVKKIAKFNFEAYGDFTKVNEVLNSINEKFFDKSFTRVNWYYKDTHGVDGCSLYIEHDNNVKNEYYPCLPKGVDAFIEEYLNSKSSVLVMYGPPGTGKTSFLKHLLCSRKLNAAVSYDEEVLSDDRFFIDFLTSTENDVLIIEDADLLLTSRESDQNKIMSKFLNVSDGIVKVNSKKMIFTTNISQLTKVDQALLRTGRCFSAVEFRKLTPNEAMIAAKSANQPDRDWAQKSEWSLAEIFNAEPDVVVEPQQPVVFGFGR
jgi:hypothetical protein